MSASGDSGSWSKDPWGLVVVPQASNGDFGPLRGVEDFPIEQFNFSLTPRRGLQSGMKNPCHPAGKRCASIEIDPAPGNDLCRIRGVCFSPARRHADKGVGSDVAIVGDRQGQRRVGAEPAKSVAASTNRWPRRKFVGSSCLATEPGQNVMFVRRPITSSFLIFCVGSFGLAIPAPGLKIYWKSG